MSHLFYILSSPPSLQWNRMGNIRGWAGPLDATWRERQYNLQLQILNRTRSFGIINALPGFSGHIPQALVRLYPNAKVFLGYTLIF